MGAGVVVVTINYRLSTLGFLRCSHQIHYTFFLIWSVLPISLQFALFYQLPWLEFYITVFYSSASGRRRCLETWGCGIRCIFFLLFSTLLSNSIGRVKSDNEDEHWGGHYHFKLWYIGCCLAMGPGQYCISWRRSHKGEVDLLLDSKFEQLTVFGHNLANT